MARVGTWEVGCPDFKKEGFKSREDAEAWIRRVEAFGQCHQRHEIRVVVNREEVTVPWPSEQALP